MLFIAALSLLHSSFVPISSSPLVHSATANGSIRKSEPDIDFDSTQPHTLLLAPILSFARARPVVHLPQLHAFFFRLFYAQHRIALVNIAAVVKHKIQIGIGPGR
jgi:hypothetical protein